MTTLTLSPVGIEALDDPATDPRLVTRMLRDIRRSNRWLGGAAAMRVALSRVLDERDAGKTLTIFDIGTGAGDLPRDAARWARRRNITLRPLGLERIPAAAAMARDAGVPVVLGCAGALPLRAQSVDIVLISQVAHHLDAASASRLFAAATLIARRAVIVADLQRGPLGALGFRLASLALGLHRVTIADGVTSLRRGYTTAGLRALCEAAGVKDAEVRGLMFSRIVAVWLTDRSPCAVGHAAQCQARR